MKQVAKFGIHFIQRSNARASLILICSLFLVSIVRGGQSSQQSAPGEKRADSLVRTEKHPWQGMQRNAALRTSSQKSRARAKTHSNTSKISIPLFLEEPQYPTAQNPTAVAVGDFNGDGKQDMAVASGGGKVSVLLGNRDGTFQTKMDYPAGLNANSIVVADFNEDGKPDLAMGVSDGVSVLLGNGDGTFQTNVEYATGGNYGAFSLEVGDFNNDGKLDLAASSDSTISVLLGNGDGSFQAHIDSAIGGGGEWVAAADFNSDGRLDLVVTVCCDGELGWFSVMLGNGDGTFQDSYDGGGKYPLIGLAVGDFNADAKPDLAWSNALGLFVQLGNGDGTFQPQTAIAYAPILGQAVVGDFNSDGKVDLALSDYVLNALMVHLGNGDGTFQGHVDYATGNVPLGAAVADFNGDGKPDLAVVNDSDNTATVRLGNGDGTFQSRRPLYSVGNYPLATAPGDFNGDGSPDLAVANDVDHTVSVLQGNGDGTFQTHVDYPTGDGLDGPESLAVADFNNDGKQDLVTANGDSTLSVLLGNGDSTFQSPVEYAAGNGPVSVTTADFNRDSKLDLAVANYEDNTVSVLLGNGDGALQTHVDYLTGTWPTSVVAADFNGDGKPDLVTANSGDCTVSVLLGNGDGSFGAHVEYDTGSCSGDLSSLTVGDLNGDGKPDLAVANYGADTINVLLGNGDGTFRTYVDYATGGSPTSVAVGDFNGDGKADLAVTSGDWQRGDSIAAGILLGDGDGTFQAIMQYASGQGAGGATVADFNNDGAPDLAVISPDNAVSILINIRPDFGMTATPGKATLSAGSSVAFSIGLTGRNGFNGAVSLTCSASPTPASAPTCSLNPNSLSPAANGLVSSTLTVSTTGPITSLVHPVHRDGGRLYGLLLPIFGIAFVGINFTNYQKTKKTILAASLITMFMLVLGLQIACGGGSNSSNSLGSGGTLAGMYTVTVNATSGSVMHRTDVTVTVQ